MMTRELIGFWRVIEGYGRRFRKEDPGRLGGRWAPGVDITWYA